MNDPIELSLEQQFSLRSFETQVEMMSREQAQEFLVKLYQQMMMKEKLYQHFLRQHWGIGQSESPWAPELGS
ncbi:NblA/ycf18 family protein [Leptolyngbya sp. FACHB-261]|uniref:NblA/ycf18 family protein n=1 Tax=Leptolyngbya sp. FACHB-261 TaxID=2692806 RepID=UPI00168315A7|nr:NblA/ycf18 family protein [Leptolyngbya sp. FACHB-261]MBD2105258.1 NblA/ycf18 family protein [Leptolyngbya sp. FACHB-261]